MSRLFVFGLGYTASRLADRLRGDSWHVAGTGRGGGIAFDDAEAVRHALASSTHVLSSVPPLEEAADPVLGRYAGALGGVRWLGYLSSTGVYGDTGGAWVDESAALKGRRGGRIEADLAWQATGAQVFRLPGIYGPGRSALDRVRDGVAHRIDLPDQVFSRVHVDDVVSAVIAGFEAPAGVYNIADDLPSSQNAVIEAACDLLGIPYPPLQSLDEVNLSEAARAFYGENRRVANARAKRVLGWRPAYPDFGAGLGALSAMTSPASATTPPAADSSDQR